MTRETIQAAIIRSYETEKRYFKNGLYANKTAAIDAFFSRINGIVDLVICMNTTNTDITITWIHQLANNISKDF